MTKERELLARTLEELSSQDAALRQEFEGLLGAWGPLTIIEEIRNYLAEPEVNREPLSLTEIAREYPYANEHEFWWFIRGIRFAEKHHSIGGEQ